MLQNFLQSIHAPKTKFARRLRLRQTSGEAMLWRMLRAKRFHGLKFRRQVPIGPFIVDFLCVERQLIIEVDGDSHAEPGAQRRDWRREAFLRSQGFSVVRFESGLVVADCEVVLAKLEQVLGLDSEGSPSPRPSPKGRGEALWLGEGLS